MAYDDVLKKVSGFFGDEEATKKKNKQAKEAARANMVMQQYTTAKTGKQDIKEKWIEYVKLWRGDHWGKKRAKWKSSTVENISFSIIETMVSLMGDRQPQINYLPQMEDDVAVADQLNQVASYVWNVDNMQEKMPTILRDTLIIGTAILKMRYDTEALNGMGEITADVVDPFHFFPDGEATSQEDMTWCILKTKMNTKTLRRIYGVDVPSDQDYTSDDHTRPTDTNNANVGKQSSVNSTVLEYWYRDENGNVRVSIVSNGYLLEDKESPFETNDFPFVFFYDHKLNGEFWGIGEFENLKPLQLELNKVRAMFMDNMIATNNTMIVVDSNSGIKVKDLKNEPGLIIEKQPGANIERLAPPHLPSHFQNQIDITKKAMQDVSGVSDVSKGLIDGQVAAASAISLLQEASQTRIRGKLRNVENSIKRLGYWYLIMIRQFYTEPRIVRLTGEEDGFRFAQFDGSSLRNQVPVMDEQTGQQKIDPDTNEPMFETLLTDFDVQISSGSSMMLNKSAKYQQVLELYKANAADLETLLLSADIGQPKEIIKRMIDYGMIADPSKPKVDLSKVLGDLGIKVNMVTTQPEAIMGALQNAQQQIDSIEQQSGVPIAGDMNNQLKQATQLNNQMLTQQELGQMAPPVEGGQMPIPEGQPMPAQAPQMPPAPPQQ